MQILQIKNKFQISTYRNFNRSFICSSFIRNRNKYKSNYQIEKAVKQQKIFKIEKGIYSTNKNVHYLEVITKKYPNAIITGESAYYYHNLTDVIPDKIYLATKRNAVRIKDKRIKQVLVSDKLFDLGKEQLVFEGVYINIYDKEKMLIELIKNKSNISFDYYKEIILNYRNIVDELKNWKIEQYLENYNLEDYIFDIIKKEVF